MPVSKRYALPFRIVAKPANSFLQSQEAYSSGDGAGAKQYSEEGKAHGRKMEDYNRQASEFIFKENNASGRVPADTIDLHGQFVEEAEEILEERIKYAKSHGQTHLHVYVALFLLSHLIGSARRRSVQLEGIDRVRERNHANFFAVSLARVTTL